MPDVPRPELSPDALLGQRFLSLCRLTDDMMARMVPEDRDRHLQEHLAAARGATRNFQLLCRMSDDLAGIRRARLGVRKADHG